MITLYNAISSDGYIAGENGNEDFIPSDVWYDFIELCGHYDAVVMGKNSYLAIQNYEPNERDLFEKLLIKKIVLSRDEKFILKSGYVRAKSIKEVLSLGKNILLSSGPSLNDVFLKEKAIDKIILNIIPVGLESGIKEFNVGKPKMVFESEKIIREGSVLRTYKVVY